MLKKSEQFIRKPQKFKVRIKARVYKNYKALKFELKLEFLLLMLA